MVLLLYFTVNPLFVKALVLKLLTKMLSANQIVGLFKVWYLKKKVRSKVDFLRVDKHQSIL